MKNNFNAEYQKQAVVYSTVIPSNIIAAYKNWSNSYKNKEWIIFCNLCEAIGRKPLDVHQQLIKDL